MSYCKKCETEKNDNEFTAKRKEWCKNCVQIYNKIYRQNNKEKYKNYKQTPEYKKKSKEYKSKTKEHIKKVNQNYYKNNKEYISARNNKYYINNIEKVRERERNRLKTNLQYRLRKNISAYLRISLKSKNKESLLKYLPYSLLELTQHLESNFEFWMSWNNWGIYNKSTWKDDDPSTWTWNIDHITPQSRFIYNCIQDLEFQKCWALDNLRPYSAKQNIIDGSRVAQENKMLSS